MSGKLPPILSTLRASNLVYSFANLRDIVNDNDSNINSSNVKEGMVEFDKPSLIITQGADDGNRLFKNTYLKHPITASAVHTFTESNRKLGLLGYDDGIVFKPGCKKSWNQPIEELPIEQKLKVLMEKFDAEIVEFDDEFASSECLYAVVVNRTEKRITLVFRGSVFGGKDWSTNFNATTRRVPEIQDFAGEKPQVHNGYAAYIFGPTPSSPSRFEDIVQVLKEIYAYKDPISGRDYSDYEFYVTGHSLGGGLAQLTAFALSGSEKCKFLPSPVTAISFASPTAGDVEYNKAFQSLERSGRLRHIRISNDGDIIAGGIPVPFVGLTQTGVNLHVNPATKMAVGYRNHRSAFSQFGFSSPWKHNLPSHEEGIFNGLNDEILSKTVEELYEEYAGDCTN